MNELRDNDKSIVSHSSNEGNIVREQKIQLLYEQKHNNRNYQI